MIADWKDISSAPRGKIESRKGSKGFVDVLIPDMVVVCQKGGVPRISHYLPDDERWNGFTKKNPPEYWDELPEAPC